MYCLLTVFVLTASLLAASEPKKGHCRHPTEPTNIKFTAETYMVQTIVRYRCDYGFSRAPGSAGYYECTNMPGKIAWKSKGLPLQCGKRLNTDYQIKSQALGNGSGLTDRCRLLPNISHASLDINYSRYQEGQEFHYYPSYILLESHRVIKCMYCNGLITWVNMTEGCIPKHLQTETTSEHLQTETTKDISEHLQTQTTRGMMTMIWISVPCTVFGAVITILLCSIFGKKKWEKRSSTKVKAAKLANENKSDVDDAHLHLNDQEI